MNLGITILLFFIELGLVGGMMYLFNEIMDWILPVFVVSHYSLYLLMMFIWTATPAIILFGLIYRYTTKDEPPTYTGGYY